MNGEFFGSLLVEGLTPNVEKSFFCGATLALLRFRSAHMLPSPLFKLLQAFRPKLAKLGSLILRQEAAQLIHHLSPRDHQLGLEVGYFLSPRTHHGLIERLDARGLS